MANGCVRKARRNAKRRCSDLRKRESKRHQKATRPRSGKILHALQSEVRENRQLTDGHRHFNNLRGERVYIRVRKPSLFNDSMHDGCIAVKSADGWTVFDGPNHPVRMLRLTPEEWADLALNRIEAAKIVQAQRRLALVSGAAYLRAMKTGD